MLDFPALAAVSGIRSAAEIETEALERATQLLWWMGCKGALRTIREDGPPFPSDPPQPNGAAGIVDLPTAVGHIIGHGYLTDLVPYAGRWSHSSVQAEVARLTAELEADLTNGKWRTSFSGKELLRHLRSRVPGLDTQMRSPPQTPAERDVDLGKRLASALLTNVPLPLAQLRQTLRQRVGLPP